MNAPIGSEFEVFADWDDIPAPEDIYEVDCPERPEPPIWMYDRIEQGNVVRFTRPKLMSLGDAVVIGDLSAPECEALLSSETVIGKSNRAPRVSAEKWEFVQGPLSELVEFLSNHPVDNNKEGSAAFFAECERTGKTYFHTRYGAQEKIEYVYKLKDRVQRIHSVAIDVDGGHLVEHTVERLRRLGLFAIIYTTHSHDRKKTAKGDRFRIIVPLVRAFDYADFVDQKTAERIWKSLYVGFCESIGVTKFDAAGMRPTQLMYLPRRSHDGAEFKHYILAGRGLRIEDMPKGDISKYTRSGARRRGFGGGNRQDTDEPAFLSDGFDLRAWHSDFGGEFCLESFLEYVGCDVLGDAGEGFNIRCPNEASHSNAGEEDYGTWACEGEDGFVIFCHHDHCSGVHTWDFLRMLEDQCVLPDSCETLSDLLCSEFLYPDGVAEIVHKADYVDATIKLEALRSPRAVEVAFSKVHARSGDDTFAALYAGVEKGGSRPAAKQKLKELLSGLDRFVANDIKRLEKSGREMLQVERKEADVARKTERTKDMLDALERDHLAHPSMDIADPLGDDLDSAFATLSKRFAVCDVDGKFRVVRKPDLNTLKGEMTSSTIIVSTKEDFISFHMNRGIQVGDEIVNPAKEFLENAPRKSGIVFAPPPLVAGDNEYNMFSGFQLPAREGDWPTLKDFIYRIVCREDEEKYRFVILWMAHMVQKPGEKPGTAVVCRGAGGCGKSTFGEILMRLVSPYAKLLDKEEHVIGRFAGEHLSKCIVAVVTEAVFGASPKVGSVLKSLVSSPTIQAEAKGMPVVTLPSYLRCYFDSNSEVVVPIEGNGSERRYFVMEISEDHRGDKEYFRKLYAAINGPEMQALRAFLENLDPSDVGYEWEDVRTAPNTAERERMELHSMRGALLELREVIQDGKVVLGFGESEQEIEFEDDKSFRIPRKEFRVHIGSAGDPRRLADRDIPAMMKQLFKVDEIRGVPLIKEARGRVGRAENDWYYEIAPCNWLRELLEADGV